MNISDSDMPVIVVGAGGHARVLIDVLQRCGREMIGLTDPSRKIGEDCYGVEVLGDDSALLSYSPDEIELVNGLGSIPGVDIRWKVAADFRSKGYRFAQVVHPSAIIGCDVSLGEGVQIMAGTVIQPGVSIGDFSIINTGATVDHDCRIGRMCHLAPGVTLSGTVDLGDYTHVGTGASIVQGITVGSNCVIAAGSVVYTDIPDNVTFIQSRKASLEPRGK